MLCIWFLSYDIAIRISDLIYVARDEAEYLNYVPPNSGSVYNIADLSEAALSTDYAALFYIAQTRFSRSICLWLSELQTSCLYMPL